MSMFDLIILDERGRIFNLPYHRKEDIEAIEYYILEFFKTFEDNNFILCILNEYNSVTSSINWIHKNNIESDLLKLIDRIKNF